MRYLSVLVIAGCLSSNAAARRCSPAGRPRAATAMANSAVVFAVPVATIVVTAPPILLYSYREASGKSVLPAELPTTAAPTGRPLTSEQVLRTHCARCHQGEAPRSGVSFFSDAGDLLVPLPRRAMLEMASPNGDGVAKMPPNDANKLSVEELEVLRAWAEPPRDLRY